MGKLLLTIFLGLFLSGGGFFIAYLYVSGIDTGSSPFLCIPALLLIIAGLYFLLKAGKSNDSVIEKGKEEKIPTSSEGFSEVLKRNNEMTQKWSQTDQLRTKLKTMQVAAEDEQNPK